MTDSDYTDEPEGSGTRALPLSDTLRATLEVIRLKVSNITQYFTLAGWTNAVLDADSCFVCPDKSTRAVAVIARDSSGRGAVLFENLKGSVPAGGPEEGWVSPRPLAVTGDSGRWQTALLDVMFRTPILMFRQIVGYADRDVAASALQAWLEVVTDAVKQGADPAEASRQASLVLQVPDPLGYDALDIHVCASWRDVITNLGLAHAHAFESESAEEGRARFEAALEGWHFVKPDMNTFASAFDVLYSSLMAPLTTDSIVAQLQLAFDHPMRWVIMTWDDDGWPRRRTVVHNSMFGVKWRAGMPSVDLTQNTVPWPKGPGLKVNFDPQFWPPKACETRVAVFPVESAEEAEALSLRIHGRGAEYRWDPHYPNGRGGQGCLIAKVPDVPVYEEPHDPPSGFFGVVAGTPVAVNVQLCWVYDAEVVAYPRF